jgi:hypothetical protein
MAASLIVRQLEARSERSENEKPWKRNLKDLRRWKPLLDNDFNT